MPTLSRPTFSITTRLHPCPGTWPNLTHRVNEFSEQISDDGNRATSTAKVHRGCQLACIIGLEELCRAEDGNFERVDITIWVEEKIVESQKLTIEKLAVYSNKVVVSSPLQLGVKDGILAIWVSIYWKADLITKRGRVLQNFFDIRYITEYGMALTPLQISDPVAVPSRNRIAVIKSSNRIKKEPKSYQSSSSPSPYFDKAAAAASNRYKGMSKEKLYRGPAAPPSLPPKMHKNVLDVTTNHRSANTEQEDADDIKNAKLKDLVGSLKALNDSIPVSCRSTVEPSPPISIDENSSNHPSTQSNKEKNDNCNQSDPVSETEKGDAPEEGQIFEGPALAPPQAQKTSRDQMDMSQLIKETTELKVKRKYEEARASLYAEKRMLYAARRKAIEEKLLLDQERLRWERSEQRAFRDLSLCRRIS